MFPRTFTLRLFAALCWFPAIIASLGHVTAEGIGPREEFFEQQIRPLLINKCQSCHDASLQESDLRLDSLDGILQGGVSGPAAIAGEPGESRLIHAVLGTKGVERMPPDTPLEEHEIMLLRRWVKMGLPWTPEDQPAPALGDQNAIGAIAKKHWAFQPIATPAPPTVEPNEHTRGLDLSAWQNNPIDAFVFDRLAKAKLAPNPPATRAEILRRLSFDLVGLPPTFAETQSFIDNSRDDATLIEETVDRLLASEHHGERWARYWLDLARYADTRDWQAQAELRYPYAYTYRDYVIASLNADKPYDQFLKEQIAADCYVEHSNAPELAALGFLTIGPQFRNDRLEQAADKIDVIGRGLMGITISCARCHDHKYDPIPIEDYYSLYGVFASCSTPDSFPVIHTAARSVDAEALADFQRCLNEKQQALLLYKQDLRRDAVADLKKRMANYLDAFVVMGLEQKKEIRGIKSQFKIMETAMTPFSQLLLQRLQRKTDRNHPVLRPWHDALSLDEKQFQQQREKLLAAWKSAPELNPVVLRSLEEAAPKNRSEIVAVYARLFSRVLEQSQARIAKTPEADAALSQAHDEEIRLALMDDGGWLDLDIEVVANASRLSGLGRKKLGDLAKEITEVEATHPGAPPRAMTLVDNEVPIKPFVLLRGEPARKGDRVDRQFISILSPEPRKPFVEGSGRRELAEAITSPTNSLTPRVLVNRVWSKYFGKGLVESLDDFGLRSEPPSHPQLLDHLASEFMRNGWSLKWLHKAITTSQTYAQSSGRREAAMRIDPDNRLLWRHNRRRLDFEAMRDSILCASGNLDTTVGGKSVKLSERPFTTRRSVYAYIDRIELDPILRTFDFASPSASAASRAETTIPQQALFGMNHPFVAEQATRIAASAQHTDRDQAIKQVYQQVFARDPRNDEVRIANSFLESSRSQSGNLDRSVWQYGYGPNAKLDANFTLMDSFRSLTHWTGKFYQAAVDFPDPELGHLRLTDSGAHTGRDNDHSVIRRWIAPDDGIVNVNGTVKHSRENGDGVIAVVRSGSVYESFDACRSEAKTLVKRIEVKQGDVIDFIVAPGKTATSDAHTWIVLIRGVGGNLLDLEWRSNTGFSAPPPPALTPLAQLAQALLLTNEFLYLD
jgi:hypothetical protein